MPASPQDLFRFLDELNILHQTLAHEPLHTVEDSRHVHAQMPGAHVKNLLVKDKKSRVFLLVAEADAQINLKNVHEKIGASGRVSFCNGETLEQLWGVKPGSVTPLGAINDPAQRVTVVLEATLMAQETVNVHPLQNTMTTALRAQDLIKFLRATDHEPMILAFAEAESAVQV